MTPKPKQGQAVDDGEKLFHNAEEAQGKLWNRIGSLGTKFGRGRTCNEVERKYIELEKLLKQWKAEALAPPAADSEIPF